MNNRQLLHDIFGHDFSDVKSADALHAVFFAKPLTWDQLARVHDYVASQTSGGIAASMRIASGHEGAPFAILAMLHGNEPAGLAGFLLAMALGEMGALSRDIICVIGNVHASTQYFEAYANAPTAHQATRDCYRCGVDEAGNLLPDMNRIPVDFLTRADATPHIQRARELHAVAQNIWGITDIHSARGNMVCFTDFKHAADLRYSPLRKVLVGLSEAIGAHASAAVNVQTFKTILAPMPHIHSHTGIEAGTHEDPQAPMVAASFTLSLLYNLGITHIAPFYKNENGAFATFTVRPRITYGDLIPDAPLPLNDMVFMAREVSGKIMHAQYEEMEAVVKGQVVAVAEPSGIALRAPFDFSGIFISKAAALYDKDPAVGPWPLPAGALASTKFCYPCDVSTWQVEWAD
jgi:hypothetical protein